ncbi:MAG: DegT/DnrJ/EryC1/StrS aminotransferase family protein [Anaerolineae bacterium]|nr:DegT/DnrJ/EryC1/StrS aminotransferase family protein [Anaerolineae bacterium]
MELRSASVSNHSDDFRRRETFLPFSPPYITEEEIAAVVDTLRTDWITTGPKTKRFEEEFAAYIGAEAALALNSCTGGLHVALAALGIREGDEVITTPITFASTANVIEHLHATSVFADVEPDTLTIDPAKVAEKITPRTKAIMPVHYAGHPADMRPLMELARQHNLYVVEDAAHSLPAFYEEQRIGTIGDLTAFSFYATKNITTAEGGMLTGNGERIQDSRLWSLHGMSRDAWQRYSKEGNWFYEIVVPGFKYNMTDIQAALGLVQLTRLQAFQQRRRQIVDRYNAAFSQIAALQTPTERPNVESAWHLYVLRLKLEQLSINRARFIEHLKDHNIGTSVHFIPVHMHPYYRERYHLKPEDFPVAYAEYQRYLSLPLHPRLSDQDVDDVISAVSEIARRYRR